MIAVFCYKRAVKLRQSIEALLRNPECGSMDVIFFCDGPKGDHDRRAVEETRTYIETVTGFRSVFKHYRECNVSTGPNFKAGLTWLCNHCDQFIVVEDDLVVTPNFVRYMLDGLDYYRNERSVFCLSGFNFPLWVYGYAYDTLVCNRFCSYGWGSWTDRVREVTWDEDRLRLLASTSPGFRRRLNAEGLDLYRMLVKQLRGTISTWDIQMQVHISEERLKVIYPVVSKATNIGFGRESTNTFGIDYLRTITDPGKRRSFTFCDPINRSDSLQQQVRRPYGIRALAGRKLINTFIKFTSPLKRAL